MEVCRIAAKVVETDVVVRGEYVFTPSQIVDWIIELNTTYLGTIIHWSECVTLVTI
jgi:hypothetical protein